MKKMKAYINNSYGQPDVLEMALVDVPKLNDDEVLVKVEALSINPAELHTLKGRIWMVRITNGLFRPKDKILSADYAGTVVKIGKHVRAYKVGDRVFGRAKKNGLAEYLAVAENETARIMTSSTFSDMASLPLVSTTALQALTSIQSDFKAFINKKVLINGASGGIGTILTQLLHCYEADITVICSSSNFELMSNLGASRFIDYKTINVNNLTEQYDYIFDLIGNLKASKIDKQLSKYGKAVLVGYTSFWKTLSFMLRRIYMPLFTTKKFIIFNAETKREDLDLIMNLVDEGKLKPIIHKEFPFSHSVDAFKLLDSKRVKGKVLISV